MYYLYDIFSIKDIDCGSIQTIPKNKTEVNNSPESSYMRSIDSLDVNSKHIDWNLFFDSMVSPTYSSKNTSITYSIKHLAEVEKLIRSTSLQVLQDYWTIQTVVQMAPRIKFPSPQEDTAVVENAPEPLFEPAYTNEVPKDSISQITCGKETSKKFNNIVGRFFALYIFGASEEKEEADRFVENIYQTWLEDLPSTTWLDNVTKAKVIEKVVYIK